MIEKNGLFEAGIVKSYPYYILFACYNIKMKLIVGLGNPGAEYERTRHNVGFRVAEALASHLKTDFSTQKKLHGELARSGDLFILKPDTFMNRSGEAVRATLDYYDKTILQEKKWHHIIVIHDDLDIPFGKFKIHQGRGPKGHNGLLSIDQSLGSEEYVHVRVGVENRGDQRAVWPGHEFVLANFSTTEDELLSTTISLLVQELLNLLRIE